MPKMFVLKHENVETEVESGESACSAGKYQTCLHVVKEPHTFFLTVSVTITLSLRWPIEFVFILLVLVILSDYSHQYVI